MQRGVRHDVVPLPGEERVDPIVVELGRPPLDNGGVRHVVLEEDPVPLRKPLEEGEQGLLVLPLERLERDRRTILQLTSLGYSGFMARPPCPAGVWDLVQRLANILAFERRCIRSSSLRSFAVLSQYAFTCAPCWRGASTLSMRQAICETLHSMEHGDQRPVFIIIGAGPGTTGKGGKMGGKVIVERDGGWRPSPSPTRRRRTR